MQSVKQGLTGEPVGSKYSKADLPAFISENIRRQILTGSLKGGDKIPTEREICEYHQVSRVVVREAISRLRHEGLLLSQQGKGVFVVAPEDSKFLSITDQSIDKVDDFRKLYEVRKILESGTAALAANYRNQTDIEMLESSIEDMANPNINNESYVEADMAFHRAIARASSNIFLAHFISFVDSKLKESISIALAKLNFRDTVEISAAEHKKILLCIKGRDANGAQLAMLEHLEKSSSRLGI